MSAMAKSGPPASHQSAGPGPEPVVRLVHGACPLDCPDTCGWVVTVQDGRAVRLQGNREHPFTRGALCEKVNHFLEHTRLPDRLLHPMRRVGKKGEGRFARISWDEAIGEIAARWRAIIDRDGPQAIWPYYGTGSLGMIQGLAGCGRRLWNVLGTSQHHLSICMTAGGFATGYTLGDNRIGMDPEGFAEARLAQVLARRIEVALPVVMIDGIHFRGRVILVALGIDAQGNKHVLGLREGSTESTRVVRSLLSDLIERGLDADRARLWVIDGGKALRKAIVETFGATALIQRCQEHKRRNVIEHLPEELHASVGRAMRHA